MATAPTLYEEVVKFGPGRLLSAQTVAGPTAFVAFTNLTGYDTFLFNMHYVFAQTAPSELVMRVSADNGATWYTSTSYWWSQIYSTSIGGGGDLSGALLGGGHTTWIYLGSYANGLADAYEVVLTYSNFPSARYVSSEWYDTHGADIRVGGGLVPGFNAVQFLFNSSNISGGLFRCYGFKRGT